MIAARFVCPTCGKREGVRLVWWSEAAIQLDCLAGECVVLGDSDEQSAANRECLACSSRWVDENARRPGASPSLLALRL